MICKKCGHEIDDGSPFCYFCGETFSNEDVKKWNSLDERDREIEEMEVAEVKKSSC